MDEYATLNEEHQLLLCTVCGHAVKPGAGVRSHFSHLHQVKGEQLKDITDYIDVESLNDPATIELPADWGEPIPKLETYDGFSCNLCRYLTTSPDSIRRHWRESKHDSEGPKYTRVKLQSWTSIKRARYWIVKEPGNTNAAAPPTGRPVESAMDKIIAESQSELQDEDLKRKEHGNRQEGIDFDSTWVKHMKWVNHFGDRDRLVIHDAAQGIQAKASTAKATASENEEATKETQLLTRLYESFDREVDRCSWRFSSIPDETLQCLHSAEVGKPHPRPFGHLTKDKSRARYEATGHRYLGFCWRAYQLGREEAASRLAMRFTDEQWSLMGDVAHELEDENEDEPPGTNTQAEPHDDSGFFSSDDDNDSSSEDWGDDEWGQVFGRRETAVMATRSLDQTVFRFMVASIKVRVGGDMYNNAMLCFCAATGIKRHPLGFTEAYLYTGVLAALAWLARLFFLEAGFEDVLPEEHGIGVEDIDRFKEEHARWLCVGTHTVMSKIINWMIYGKGHRNKTAGPPTVRWADNHEALVHNGERLVVREFQQAACRIVVQADKLLNELLGGTWHGVGPGIDMKRIVDSTSRLGAGESFATNEKNTWLDVGPGKVLRSMEASIFDKKTNQWKRAGVRRWLRWLRVFREALMLLSHIWEGQPGRGPETATLRHCDTWQLLRNVFLYDGQVMLVTDRDKMKAIRGTGRVVARFLPDRIGRMMVAYIAWLLPAERTLRRKCKFAEPRDDCLEFLWRNGNSKCWGTERLSSIMTRMLQAEIKMRLGVSRYRVMAIEFGRRIRGLVIRQIDGMAGDDEDEEGIEMDQMTGEALDVRGSWNIVWDLQSTHSTKMARLHYAVHVGMPNGLTPEMMENYRGISRLWHQFLMEGDEFRAGWKRKAPGDESISMEARKKKKSKKEDAPSKEENERQMVDGLRMVIGPASTWRPGKQRECMEKILALQGEESVICVLPTGAGKSLLFMVPAVMRGGGTNVVVVPFAALMTETVEKARRMGVDVVEFRPSVNSERESLPRAARMVVVGADTVSVPSLLGYLDGLDEAGLLQRIFIDEAHTAITDASYRVKLTQLKGLTRYQKPMVLLTATLPVTFERWFREELLAASAETIRERTTKANCRYEVEQVKAGRGGVSVDARVVELVRQLDSTMVSGQKGVVYCRSKMQCEALANEIGCSAHHSGMEKAAQDEARESWASGGGHRWIVATTGLGTGIDIGGIVAVLHAGFPYGLVDFVQQTGRGARRDGEEVRSMIVHDGSAQYERVGTDKVKRINRHQMEMFIKSPGCYREVLSSFMDGEVGETCADIAGAIPCGRCHPTIADGSNGDEASSKDEDEEPSEEVREKASEGIWRRFNRVEGEKVSMLIRWLDEVQDICAVCHVRNCKRTRVSEAISLTDRHKRAGEVCEPIGGQSYDGIRQRIRFAENSCCFRCKLPSDWCDEIRENSGEGEDCMYLDKVLPVALMPMGHESLRRWVVDKFEIDPENTGEWYKWLAGRVRFHGTTRTNIHVLWEAIVQKAYGKHVQK